MKNFTKEKQGGFIQIIIIIVIAMLLMRYLGLTISGIMDYFHLSWPGIINWFKDLFNSIK